MTAESTAQHPLSSEQEKQWKEEGYLILRGIIPPENIEAIRNLFANAVEQKINNLLLDGAITEVGAGLPLETRFAKVAGTHANVFGRGWREDLTGREIYDLHRSKEQVAVIAALCGGEVDATHIYNGRPKLPGQELTTVPWHQDSGYFGEGTESSLIITSWIPVVPVDADTGCLQVIPGSHRAGLKKHITEEAAGKFLVITGETIDETKAVTCAMEPGDILLMHNLTFHRSLPNVSDRIRWSIDIRYARAGDFAGESAWAKPTDRWIICSNSRTPTSFEEWLRMSGRLSD